MNVYSEINKNKAKTYFIMFLFFVLVGSLLYVIGKALGYSGVSLFVFAFLLSIGTSFFSYFFSDSIVLGMHGAVEAKRAEYFDLYTVTENLAIAAGIPKPRIFVITDNAPNAFATGRDYKHAVVAVTTGLLSVLDRRELEGVIAHELSHIKNYDILVMTIVSVLVGSIVYLTDFFMRSMWFRSSDDDNRGSAIFMVLAIVSAILAPIAATLMQLAVSRKREFLADASGVYLTRYPDGLARALEKIEGSHAQLKSASNSTAHLFISSPFSEKKKNAGTSWLVNLFSTHPPIEERIKRLRSM
jgi:heat shock protein HtpX